MPPGKVLQLVLKMKVDELFLCWLSEAGTERMLQDGLRSIQASGCAGLGARDAPAALPGTAAPPRASAPLRDSASPGIHAPLGTSPLSRTLGPPGVHAPPGTAAPPRASAPPGILDPPRTPALPLAPPTARRPTGPRVLEPSLQHGLMKKASFECPWCILALRAMPKLEGPPGSVQLANAKQHNQGLLSNPGFEEYH